MNIWVFRILRLLLLGVVSAAVLIVARRTVDGATVAWLWAVLAMLITISVLDVVEGRLFGGDRADPGEGE